MPFQRPSRAFVPEADANIEFRARGKRQRRASSSLSPAPPLIRRPKDSARDSLILPSARQCPDLLAGLLGRTAVVAEKPDHDEKGTLKHFVETELTLLILLRPSIPDQIIATPALAGPAAVFDGYCPKIPRRSASTVANKSPPKKK